MLTVEIHSLLMVEIRFGRFVLVVEDRFGLFCVRFPPSGNWVFTVPPGPEIVGLVFPAYSSPGPEVKKTNRKYRRVPPCAVKTCAVRPSFFLHRWWGAAGSRFEQMSKGP